MDQERKPAQAEGTAGSDALCESCGASIRVGASEHAVRCPFCDASTVLNRPRSPGAEAPVFVLPFQLTGEQARRNVAEWIAVRKMAPSGLRRRAAERLMGVYIPVYLFSAAAHSDYLASIGESIGERSRRKGAAGDGPPGDSETVEYRELHGSHTTYLADVVVTASLGVGNAEIRAIGPYDWGPLRRYAPDFVAGWNAEEPSLSLEEGLSLAREQGREVVRKELQAFMPGDWVRDLQPSTVFDEESLDLTLVPVWVFAFRYHRRKPPLRVLVNGQTGKVSGALPTAWGKLLAIVLAVAIVAAGLVLAISLLPRIEP